jgi:hypothetical protein
METFFLIFFSWKFLWSFFLKQVEHACRSRVAQLEKELQQECVESSQQKSEKEKVQKALEKERKAHEENVASMEAQFKQATSMQLLSAKQVWRGPLMIAVHALFLPFCAHADAACIMLTSFVELQAANAQEQLDEANSKLPSLEEKLSHAVFKLTEDQIRFATDPFPGFPFFGCSLVCNKRERKFRGRTF